MKYCLLLIVRLVKAVLGLLLVPSNLNTLKYGASYSDVYFTVIPPSHACYWNAFVVYDLDVL